VVREFDYIGFSLGKCTEHFLRKRRLLKKLLNPSRNHLREMLLTEHPYLIKE